MVYVPAQKTLAGSANLPSPVEPTPTCTSASGTGVAVGVGGRVGVGVGLPALRNDCANQTPKTLKTKTAATTAQGSHPASFRLLSIEGRSASLSWSSG